MTAGERVKVKQKRIRRIKALAAYLFLALGSASMVLPFLWMLTTSLARPDQVWTRRAWWEGWVPTTFAWQNYVAASQVVPFLRFYWNSIFVALCTTLGVVVTSSLSGYAFARLRFHGRDKLFLGYLATMMIPSAVTMIPVFILLRMLGWIDTYQALILPGIFTAYGTFLLRQFFLTLPKELEDAAKIDGCSLFGIYSRIILPLSQPALATLTIFTFLGSWTNFMWPLIVMSSPERYTLPVGLAYFQSLHFTDWTLLMAGAMMMIAPIILVFMFTQRYFVEGIKLTGIKG